MIDDLELKFQREGKKRKHFVGVYCERRTHQRDFARSQSGDDSDYRSSSKMIIGTLL